MGQVSGLLLAGIVFPVAGVTIIGPHEKSWSHLSPGDCRKRRGRPQMFVGHTTKGVWPQRIVDELGPAGRAQRTAEMWIGDPTYSGAHGVTGSDGVAACLADLILTCAYHATYANDRAIGWEIYQEAGGVIHRAALVNTAKIADEVAERAMIPRQFPRRRYNGAPLARLSGTDGGPTCYGFFGHRDQTDRRGRGDPGDAYYEELEALGFEGLDFEAGEDLEIWRKRQALLNAMGENLKVDGLPGVMTIQALRRRGFRDGKDLLPARG